MQDKTLRVTTVLLEDKESFILPKDYPFDGEVRHISVSDRYDGWTRIRKENDVRYVCFNVGNVISQVDEKQLDDLKSGKIKMVILGIQGPENLALQYRNNYYGYDYSVMLSVLKKDYPGYYKYADKEIFRICFYYQLCGIFNKKEYDKIWDWIDGILIKCEKSIPVRRSSFQNKWREHLALYLFTIYISYWQVRVKYSLSMPIYLETNGGSAECETVFPANDAMREDIISFLSGLVADGKVEDAIGFSLNVLSDRQDMEDICAVFKEYERQRKYSDLTDLDRAESLEELLSAKSDIGATPIISGKPQMLVFHWCSVGHETSIKAFESFGFECTCISMPGLKKEMDEECFDRVNKCLDSKRYDVAFSTNSVELFAEACYLHDVPYLAWCYDAPTFIGKRKYLTYPTTNLFLFDSDDARHYSEAGIERTHYLPLATNLEYFEGVKCSDEDREKYSADISFIGNLYDARLPKAMRYLTDYQKAYLNALMDNQLDIYGYNFFDEVVTPNISAWLNNPEFNKIVNNEYLKDLAPDRDKKSCVSPAGMKLILNRQTTNKERLLLLTLLAKHYEVKLYSTSTNEVFKDLTFCGTADYYVQMPKIFRCSKINLNATLRSIQSGIPLRCIDVMGCGGCLLTNYQKDFDDHFKDEENILFYRDAHEALEKADFYIKHDTLREKIALSGHETIKKYYDYPVKIKEMLEMADLQYIIKACGR